MIDNQIQQFQHEEFGNLQVMMIDDSAYFPASECARILGYAKPVNAVERHCRYALKQGIPHPQSPGKEIVVNFIPEPDLYRLIIRSKLPAAEKFERWVFDTVLPSIRRHGAYFTPETLAAMLDSPEFTKKILETVQAENNESESLRKQVAALAPKARYYDIILQSKNLVQTSIIAKDYGLSAVRFNRLLHDMGIQYRMGSTWLLYQEYANQGYTKSRTYRASENTSVIHTYWTQKGRLFLYEHLKKEGIVPVMEDARPERYSHATTPPEAGGGSRGNWFPREVRRDGALAESPAFSAENARTGGDCP